MRALRRRPTTLERWPKGVHPGIVLSTREQRGGDAFYQKRVPEGRSRLPRDRPDRSSPPAGTPTRSARPRSPSSAGRRRWARSRSIRGRCATTTSTIPTSCASTSTRSRAPTSPTPSRVAAEARALLEELGYTGFPKTSGGRGIHIYVRIEPRWTFTDVRHAAIALRPRARAPACRTRSRRTGGRRSAASASSSTTTRTPATARSRRPTASAPSPGAPVSAPLTWEELPGVTPEDFTVETMPARFAEVGDRHAAIDDVAHSLEPLLELYERDEPRRHAVSARLPEDAGRAQARAAVARPGPADGLGRLGQLRRCRAGAAGADGGGTTGPMSPSGASSRSTMTGAWSLGPLPLRACRSTHAASHAFGDRVAGEHEVDPHPEVLVEHAGAVVPVREHAAGRASGRGRRRAGRAPAGRPSAARSGGVTWVCPT